VSMIRWEPFADMTQLRAQVNRLFEQTLSQGGHEPVAPQSWAPAVDVLETEDALVLRAEVPGITPADIQIQLVGDTLTLKGERKFEQQAKGRQYLRVERAYGIFQRSFTLGIPVKNEAVQANYREGVLEITLPKAEEVKPKQITIHVTGESVNA
jgi:HSP20 family protein